MKKILLTIVLVLTLMAVSHTALAQPSGGGSGGPTPAGGGGGRTDTSIFFLKNPLEGQGITTVGGLVSNFLVVFTYLVVIAAVLLIIWTGFQFVMTRGDAKKMVELKDRLLWIVVGLSVIIGARIIVQVIINTLGDTGVVNQRVIDSAQSGLDQTR